TARSARSGRFRSPTPAPPGRSPHTARRSRRPRPAGYLRLDRAGPPAVRPAQRGAVALTQAGRPPAHQRAAGPAVSGRYCVGAFRILNGVRRVTATASRRPAPGGDRPPAERLLSAAEHLFGERSYRRTSVADICARAGIATGSFYAHYGSKNDIFAAVVRRINADLRAAMRAALESEDVPDGQRDRERVAFRAFFQMLSKRPWIDRIVRESEFVDPGLFREYYERLGGGPGAAGGPAAH